MNKKKMSNDDVIQHYELESRKMRIRAMCDTDPIKKTDHEKRAVRFKKLAESLKKHFNKPYQTATIEYT